MSHGKMGRGGKRGRTTFPFFNKTNLNSNENFGNYIYMEIVGRHISSVIIIVLQLKYILVIV